MSTKRIRTISNTAVEALREKGSLKVTTHLDVIEERFHRLLDRESLRFMTEAGPMAVQVSHVELGYLNRGAHDGALTAYGQCYTTEKYFGGESSHDTFTHVRIIFYGEAESCWVEHIATLPGLYSLRMSPTLFHTEDGDCY